MCVTCTRRLYMSEQAAPLKEGRPEEEFAIADPTSDEALQNFPDRSLVAWTAIPLLIPLDSRIGNLNRARAMLLSSSIAFDLICSLHFVPFKICHLLLE